MLTPWKESYDQIRQNIKKQRHYFVNKAMVFPVVMYECEKNHELPKYERKLSTEGLMLLNSGVGEDS